jgi:endonuclease YncB( thermonuclease family)
MKKFLNTFKTVFFTTLTLTTSINIINFQKSSTRSTNGLDISFGNSKNSGYDDIFDEIIVCDSIVSFCYLKADARKVLIKSSLDPTDIKITWLNGHKLDQYNFYYATSSIVATSKWSTSGIEIVGTRPFGTRNQNIIAIPKESLVILDYDPALGYRPITPLHFFKAIKYLDGFTFSKENMVDVPSDPKVTFANGYSYDANYIYTTSSTLGSLKNSEKSELGVVRVGTKGTISLYGIPKSSLVESYIDYEFKDPSQYIEVFGTRPQTQFNHKKFKESIDEMQNDPNLLSYYTRITAKDFALTKYNSIDPEYDKSVSLVSSNSCTDGDTFNQTRLKGVDTPEKKSTAAYRLGDNNFQNNFGKIATKACDNYLKDNDYQVYLQDLGKDIYNRGLSYVFSSKDRTSYTVKMVAEGHGIVSIFASSDRRDPVIQEAMLAQLHAAYNQKGIFDLNQWRNLKSSTVDNLYWNISYIYSEHNMSLIFPQGREWSFNYCGPAKLTVKDCVVTSNESSVTKYFNEISNILESKKIEYISYLDFIDKYKEIQSLTLGSQLNSLIYLLDSVVGDQISSKYDTSKWALLKPIDDLDIEEDLSIIKDLIVNDGSKNIDVNSILVIMEELSKLNYQIKLFNLKEFEIDEQSINRINSEITEINDLSTLIDYLNLNIKTINLDNVKSQYTLSTQPQFDKFGRLLIRLKSGSTDTSLEEISVEKRKNKVNTLKQFHDIYNSLGIQMIEKSMDIKNKILSSDYSSSAGIRELLNAIKDALPNILNIPSVEEIGMSTNFVPNKAHIQDNKILLEPFDINHENKIYSFKALEFRVNSMTVLAERFQGFKYFVIDKQMVESHNQYVNSGNIPLFTSIARIGMLYNDNFYEDLKDLRDNYEFNSGSKIIFDVEKNLLKSFEVKDKRNGRIHVFSNMDVKITDSLTEVVNSRIARSHSLRTSSLEMIQYRSLLSAIDSKDDIQIKNGLAQTIFNDVNYALLISAIRTRLTLSSEGVITYSGNRPETNDEQVISNLERTKYNDSIGLITATDRASGTTYTLSIIRINLDWIFRMVISKHYLTVKKEIAVSAYAYDNLNKRIETLTSLAQSTSNNISNIQAINEVFISQAPRNLISQDVIQRSIVFELTGLRVINSENYFINYRITNLSTNNVSNGFFWFN